MLKMFEQVISLFETLISSSGFWALASAFLGYRYGLKMQIVKIEKEQKLDIVKEKIKVINEYLDMEQKAKYMKPEDFLTVIANSLTKVIMYCSDETKNTIQDYLSFSIKKQKYFSDKGSSENMDSDDIEKEISTICQEYSKVQDAIWQEMQEILNMYIEK